MNDETVLDAAHRAMAAAPEDGAARLAFYARLAEAELFLLLEAEPAGDEIAPQVFALEDGPVVLVFDAEERLSAFTGAPAPYAALPGRDLAAMLAGQGLGLGVNLGQDAAILLPSGAVDWLAGLLAARPEAVEARPEELRPPSDVPEQVLRALDARLARAGGLARHAWLAGVIYPGGRAGHMLAFVDAAPGAEAVLSRAVGEALGFSGAETGALDVAFIGPDDPLAGPLGRVGLRFDLPEPERPEALVVDRDPDAPPRLR
ncbi:hypothetical protein Ga0609869_002167 [Rhodovulum iodosum]|uniref:SseB protein N-terminal domain-containing protein n=1 Tax=Rhodovulum iodosum TaxID=68291 RepID=A0ABV3XUG5_9RHOB|nr:SseB family protein [Rhodovulum robiginosum]RSK32244.1 SseB family protein [Rhodovulum robiginosum]